MTTIQETSTATADGAAALVPRPPRLRRRWSLVLVSLMLAVLGAGAAVVALRAVATTEPVVAAASTIERGTVIERSDLTVVQVGVDPALSPVPGGELESLVGMRAAFDTPAGGLLTQASVTDAVTPGVGLSVVGVSLPDALLPGEPLRVGDTVRVVPTAGADPDAVVPDPLAARVVGLYPDEATASTLVSVEVGHDEAPTVAGLVAAGRVALVLDSRAG